MAESESKPSPGEPQNSDKPVENRSPPVINLININPLVLVFPKTEAQRIKQEIQIVNSSKVRIGWRVLCNAPTRYAICPNKGFLNAQETVTLNVLLIAADKYNRRHNFVVQAKPVKEDENNRKTVWKKTDIGVQNIRVNTMREGDVVRSGFRRDSSVSSVQSTDTTSSASNASQSSGAPSPVQPIDHGPLATEVEMKTKQLREAVAEKELRATRLVSAVNEAKRLEVDLDRIGQTTFQLQQKQENANKLMQELNIRLEMAKQDLATMKERPN